MGSSDIILLFLLISALDVSGWLSPRSDRFIPAKESLYPFSEVRWAPGPLWADAENLTLARIRPPGLSARSCTD